jgi:predicted transcriptional regulator
MPSDALKLTAQIVISHASMSVLAADQLVGEIREVYGVLSSLEAGVVPAIMAPKKGEEAGVVKKKPSIPLKDIVQEKFVHCLECGRKMKSLKVHLRKSHGLTPKEYFWKYDLDPKQYPLVARGSSAKRSQMAKDRGFGQGGSKKKATA